MRLSFYKRILQHLKRDSLSLSKENPNLVTPSSNPDSVVGLRANTEFTDPKRREMLEKKFALMTNSEHKNVVELRRKSKKS